MDLEIGALAFSKFIILEKIGSGGMGAVYKARDQVLDRTIALKILDSQIDPQSFVRFQNEARTLGRLQHSNIATVYDFGVGDEGSAFIAMDYIEGKNLREFIEGGEVLSLEDKLRIFAQLCETVKYAHSENVIHRDIKPENIMLVTRQDELFVPVLLDFGIAKLQKEEDQAESLQRLTKCGAILGSPLFMSPEQTAGEAVTRLSDHYSLGCVLFYLLTGRPPFEGETALETLTMHREMTSPSLADVTGQKFPDVLEDIVMRLLAKQPAVRFQSLDEVATDISSLIAELAAEEERAAAIQAASSSTEEVVKSSLSKPLVVSLFVLTVCVCLLAFSITRPQAAPRVFDQQAITNSVSGGTVNELTGLINSRTSDKTIDRLSLPEGFSDEYLAVLKGLRNLSVVELGFCEEQSDRTTKYILESKSPVVVLKIPDSSVRTLQYVSAMKALEELEIDHTKVDDDSVRKLEVLPMLTTLRVRGNKLTDRVVESWQRMPSLETLHVEDTEISRESCLALAERMPYLKICPYVETCRLKKFHDEALIAYKRERFDESLALYRDIEKIVVDAWGSRNTPFLCKILRLEAECLEKMNRDKEAENKLVESEDIARRCRHSRFLLNSLVSHAGLLERQERLSESLKLRRETVPIAYSMYGAGSVMAHDCVSGYIGLLNKLQDFQGKRGAIEDHYARMKALGFSHGERFMQATSWMGEAAAQRAKWKEAQSYFDEAVRLWHMEDSPGLRSTAFLAQQYFALSHVHERMGEREEALKYARMCLKCAPDRELRRRQLARIKKLEATVDSRAAEKSR